MPVSSYSGRARVKAASVTMTWRASIQAASTPKPGSAAARLSLASTSAEGGGGIGVAGRQPVFPRQPHEQRAQGGEGTLEGRRQSRSLRGGHRRLALAEMEGAQLLASRQG